MTASCTSSPGQYFDQETGLHYNMFRDYDPKTGRYVEPDPIGLAGGMNLFIYAGINPASRIDPSGLFEDAGQWYEPSPYVEDFIGGSADIVRGRRDMIDAGTVGADTYFHCRANCEASSRGQGGYDAARILSWLREEYQGERPEDRARDEKANAQGQCAGKDNPDVDCYRACANLIPTWGIPQRHLPPNADPNHFFWIRK